jgi:hypothetical protein
MCMGIISCPTSFPILFIRPTKKMSVRKTGQQPASSGSANFKYIVRRTDHRKSSKVAETVNFKHIPTNPLTADHSELFETC